MAEQVYYQFLLVLGTKEKRVAAWTLLDRVRKDFGVELTGSIRGRHAWNEDLHLRLYYEGEDTEPYMNEVRYNRLRARALSPAGEIWLRLNAPEGIIEEAIS